MEAYSGRIFNNNNNGKAMESNAFSSLLFLSLSWEFFFSWHFEYLFFGFFAVLMNYFVDIVANMEMAKSKTKATINSQNASFDAFETAYFRKRNSRNSKQRQWRCQWRSYCYIHVLTSYIRNSTNRINKQTNDYAPLEFATYTTCECLVRQRS